jgi:CRISPR-associated protein Cas2
VIVIVAYDIIDDRRREDVAMLLSGYGPRVQLSVFECEVRSADELRRLRAAVRERIDTWEDQVRLYPTTTQTSDEHRYRSTPGRPESPRCSQALFLQVKAYPTISWTNLEDQFWWLLDTVLATATIIAGQGHHKRRAVAKPRPIKRALKHGHLAMTLSGVWSRKVSAD